MKINKIIKLALPILSVAPLVTTISCGEYKNERFDQLKKDPSQQPVNHGGTTHTGTIVNQGGGTHTGVVNQGGGTLIGTPINHGGTIPTGIPVNQGGGTHTGVVNQGGGTHTGTVVNQGGTHVVSNPVVSPAANIIISEPVLKHGFNQNEITSDMWQKIASSNQGHPWAGDWQIYEVQLEGTTHKFNFAFDADSHVPKDIAKDIINRFAKYTNYGYGILTLNNIIVTNKKMGSAGWGGAGKDLLVQCEDITGKTDVEKVDIFQKTMTTLQHEYGHHETSTLIDQSGLIQCTNLVKNNVIGSEMYTNTKSDPLKTTATNPSALAEQSRLDTLFQSKGSGARLDNVLETFFGPQTWFGNMVNGYKYDKNFWFDMNYHMSNLEFLNRVMNILEMMPWDKTNLKTLYSFPDIVKYEIDTRKMIDLTTKEYTPDAKKLIELYGKYVYGYDGYGVGVSPWRIKGFSTTDFDFVTLNDQSGKSFTTKIEKIKSHYLTKDALFDEPKIVNSSIAFNGDIREMVPGASVPMIDQKTIKFYQDTNHDGVLEVATDKVVTIPFRIVQQ